MCINVTPGSWCRRCQLRTPQHARKTLKPLAKRLGESDPKKYTQKTVARLLGVSQQTVSDWFMHNTGVGKLHKPEARVVVRKSERPKIAAMAKKGKSQRQIAADYKTDHRTIGRHLKADQKEKALAGERKARMAKAGKNEKVIHADFREYYKANIKPGSVDLIFTDPPYDKKSLALFDPLGKCASKVLRPGGSLITYFGQWALLQVGDALRTHLKYWWIIAAHQPGSSARMPGGIRVQWKPRLWFVKPPYTRTSVVTDYVVSPKPEKRSHAWQQNIEVATYWIEKLTYKHGVGFDPFCGGGTTAVAAKRLGRQYLTTDIDEASVAITTERLQSDTGERRDACTVRQGGGRQPGGDVGEIIHRM